MSERRFWKLYREERVKFVRSLDPKVKKPFQVTLTAPQITRVARRAAARLDGGHDE